MPCPSVFGEATKQLTIVIPAYNEEDRLPATLTETLRWARAWIDPSPLALQEGRLQC